LRGSEHHLFNLLLDQHFQELDQMRGRPFGSIAFAGEDAWGFLVFPKHLHAPFFSVGAAMAVRAQGNQVCHTVFMAFTPRNYVSLFKRQWIAANRAVVSRLEKNFAAYLYRNGGPVAHS
jgi:hypothetical protein